MSRTKKDRPYWVKVNDDSEPRTAHHDHTKFGKIVKYWNGRVYRYADECTIDRPETRTYKDSDELMPCGYNLGYGWRYYIGKAPNREARLDTYYRPLRVMERDSLKKATREYNTYGEIEDTVAFPDSYQHCMLNGGYW